MENKYPVYIISKGRAYNPITAKSFETCGIDYKIVIEPQEYAQYAKAISTKKIICTPFSNLGLGSYPARNFCWEHSMQAGNKRHWIFDDNIHGFDKWINARKTKVNEGGAPLIYVEKYADKNTIDVCGFEYDTFVMTPPKQPFKNMCHVYSGILINNAIPYRWRLKYNEDVDLCLQVLHNGGKTASCIYYMINKVSTTSKMKGGNQAELYKGNDPKKKLLKAKMLEAVWPEYAKTVIRFNRYHHFVDWKIFQKKTK